MRFSKVSVASNRLWIYDRLGGTSWTRRQHGPFPSAVRWNVPPLLFVKSLIWTRFSKSLSPNLSTRSTSEAGPWVEAGTCSPDGHNQSCSSLNREKCGTVQFDGFEGCGKNLFRGTSCCHEDVWVTRRHLEFQGDMLPKWRSFISAHKTFRDCAVGVCGKHKREIKKQERLAQSALHGGRRRDSFSLR